MQMSKEAGLFYIQVNKEAGLTKLRNSLQGSSLQAESMVGESYGGHFLHPLSIFALRLERKACHFFIFTSPWGKTLTFSHGSEDVSCQQHTFTQGLLCLL